MRINRVLQLGAMCLTVLPPAARAFKINPGILTPVVMKVTPDRAAPSEIVTATGLGLDRSIVRNVYLVDAEGQTRVEILDQRSTLVRFRVPGRTPPGRKQLVLEVAYLS